MKLYYLLPVFFLLFVVGCHRVPDEIEPKINYAIQDRYLRSLPSPFPKLSEEERREPWGVEYLVGIGFAGELDLYQALTAFKRAYFLAPAELVDRKLELQYNILLAYYFGRKYRDVIYTYESSELSRVGQSFPAAHDLLVILYDSYLQANQRTKAYQTLENLRALFPETELKLQLSTALISANFGHLECEKDEDVQTLLNQYCNCAKSVRTAQTLNALFPGTGYAYIGQKQAALTAFFLNSLFIAAAYHFFNKGYVAAGIITAGFEMGWYFGGIHGAKEETLYYNARVWEELATPMMNQKKLFPGFMIKYAF